MRTLSAAVPCGRRCKLTWATIFTWVTVVALSVTATDATAGDSAVLPADRRLADARLGKLKDLNGYFPFEVPSSKVAWNERARLVKRRVLTALGLWPPPTRTPLHAVIHGRREFDDYTVEKVYFESLPGFYVTGNLYRPKRVSGKVPGVLCPHGHWPQGRFMDAGVDRVRQQIVNGEERFEEGGRSPLQSRCVQLARMGCVVFHYDMIGYADSTQLSFELAHRFARQRSDAISPENWGLFSPQAESHLQSIMGLQTWNSIRSIDFLLELPEVDSKRLAVTGASGGGTQSFILAAVDPRIAVAMPCVMVSTAMQGGCTCENACLLRIGTGNVEIAALFAPKPLGLTAADDWTVEMETKGFPQLQQLYRLLGAPDDVMLAALTHFKHNYNYVSRARMYAWMNRHLKLGWQEPIVEEDHRHLTAAELTVWDDKHPRPEGGEDFERRLLRSWADDVQRQLDELAFGNAEQFEQYRELVDGALKTMLRGEVPSDPKRYEFDETQKGQEEGALRIGGVLRDTVAGTENPVLFFLPQPWNGDVVIWISGTGKSDLYANGSLTDGVRHLLRNGICVASIDLLQQGEFLPAGAPPLVRQRKVDNPREAAAYTYGYNDALFAKRVQDVLRFTGFIRTHQRRPRQVALLGVNGGGHIAAAARSIARDAFDVAAIDTGGFRFLRVPSIYHVDFLPGGARYHDLPGMLAAGAPRRVAIAGEGKKLPPVVARAYQQLGQPAGAVVADPNPTQMAKWLAKVLAAE